MPSPGPVVAKAGSPSGLVGAPYLIHEGKALPLLLWAANSVAVVRTSGVGRSVGEGIFPLYTTSTTGSPPLGTSAPITGTLTAKRRLPASAVAHGAAGDPIEGRA